MEESRDVDACVSFNGQSNIKLKASDNVIIRHKHHQLQPAYVDLLIGKLKLPVQTAIFIQAYLEVL